MNNYFEEIINICKMPLKEITDELKIIQIGNRALYISNFKKLLEYGGEKITLKTKTGNFVIEGNDLFIRQANKGELMVSGNIMCCGANLDYEKKTK